MHPAGLPESSLLEQCEQTRTRRSGPGGQHRNKVESAIVLVHLQSGIRVEASERRSQAENLHVAVRRMRIELALELRHQPGNAPSALWSSRCQKNRLTVNPDHDDFPSLLAEALDFITEFDFDVRSAAECLQISSSQLVRFLNDEPRALSAVNTERSARGLRRLRP